MQAAAVSVNCSSFCETPLTVKKNKILIFIDLFIPILKKIMGLRLKPGLDSGPARFKLILTKLEIL